MTTLQNMLQEGFSYPSTPTLRPVGKLRLLAGAGESAARGAKGSRVGLKSKALSIAPD